MWRIWKSRNNLLFNKQIPHPLNDAEFAGAEVKVWLDATNKTSTSNQPYQPPSPHSANTNFSWTRPPIGVLKCNVDVAFCPSSKQVKGGWIIRDSSGISHYWSSACLGLASLPLKAEGKALLMAIQSGTFMGYHSLIFESDCHNLVSSLTGQ